MRITACMFVCALIAGPALAGQQGTKVPTDEEIRSGAIIDDGLDIPHIRPGTLYFEINGSTRIARALGDAGPSLPTDLVWADREKRERSPREALAW